MSKKLDFQKEKNPLRMVIYIALVAVLLVCLAGLYLNSRARHKSFEEQVQQAVQNETEYVMKRRETETETETEKATEKETEGETESESETETDYSVSVLVLNGTQRPGVAGYWQEQLESEGYTDVMSASYSETVDEETVIYSDDIDMARPFLDYFQDASFELGTVEEGIEPEDGQELPEEIDVYVVIGKGDVPEM